MPHSHVGFHPIAHSYSFGKSVVAADEINIVFFRLLLLFVGVPLLELAILHKLAQLISLWRTVLLVFLTGILGATLARRQGIRTYVRIQDELRAGRMPTESLLDAAMIFVAGAVLLTPGILTDLFGFFLLIPAGRRWLRVRIGKWIRARFHVSSQTAHGFEFDDGVIDSYAIDQSKVNDRDSERE